MNFSKEKIEAFSRKWLEDLQKNHLDENASWIGIYWLESFIDPSKKGSTDLILGPYIGFDTPHVRISLQKGLCGRAIRENQTLNIDDVSHSSEYLSCSLETKSEIVIPIRFNNRPVGELDVDCKILKGFPREKEKDLENQVLLFEKNLAQLF